MLISSAPLNAALSYPAFGALVGQLVNEHRASGPDQLPVLAHLAKESEGRTDRLVLFRSEYPILMVAYQSNGKNSIPKCICLDATLTELGTWGPCPASAETLSHRLQAEFGLPITQLLKQMNTWSDDDQERFLHTSYRTR